MNELMRRLGNPRLPERNLAIYTPPYYLERGELALARAVIQRGERLVALLPGDRWLALYVEVYRACFYASVCAAEPGDAAEVTEEMTAQATPAATEAAIARALEVSRASDFRMETFVLVYQSRFERARGNVPAARAAAEAALARAIDPLRENPFDEILARRALAEVWPGADGAAQLSKALALAARHHNVLQEGIVRATLAGRLWDTEPRQAAKHLDAAESWFAVARAERWVRRVQDRLRRT
jgi:eukaryotic-like serine/threonine-protein kinase